MNEMSAAIVSDIQQHPKYQEIRQSHCAEYQTPIQVFTVYMDLVECKGWWNVQIEDNVSLGTTLVSGHSSQTTDRQYVLPVDSQTSLSHAQIQAVMRCAHEDYKSGSVILAIIDDNSSIVYYQASGILCPPNPADTVESKHAKSQQIFERRKQILRQLREEAKQKRLGPPVVEG